tara:strand:- start:2488 stop:2727 length:240 start_codon:yes stop_codon:yes gene_type:complete
MFEQLISLKGPFIKSGVVESVKSNHYLAHELDKQGNIIKQAPRPFKSLAQAKTWLKKRGIHTISLRQSPAYFEMIGLGA